MSNLHTGSLRFLAFIKYLAANSRCFFLMDVKDSSGRPKSAEVRERTSIKQRQFPFDATISSSPNLVK